MYRAVSVVVVARCIGEAPRVGNEVAWAAVGSATQVQTAETLAFDPGDRAACDMGAPIVNYVVRCDGDIGIGFGNEVHDRTARIVVVAGHIRERPRISRIWSGVGVRCATQVKSGEGL